MRFTWKFASAFFFLAVYLMQPAAFAQTTRHYFIQAEDVWWDFAPSGQDLADGGEIPKPWTRSHLFPKVRYVEYTDATFSIPRPHPVARRSGSHHSRGSGRHGSSPLSQQCLRRRQLWHPPAWLPLHQKQ